MGDRQYRVRNEGFRWLPQFIERSNPYSPRPGIELWTTGLPALRPTILPLRHWVCFLRLFKTYLKNVEEIYVCVLVFLFDDLGINGHNPDKRRRLIWIGVLSQKCSANKTFRLKKRFFWIRSMVYEFVMKWQDRQVTYFTWPPRSTIWIEGSYPEEIGSIICI